MDYITLAVVRFAIVDAYLFKAPKFSVRAGDIVSASIQGEKKTGIVLMADNYSMKNVSDKEEIGRMITAFRTKWPLQAIEKKIKETTLTFEEGELDGEEDEIL